MLQQLPPKQLLMKTKLLGSSMLALTYLLNSSFGVVPDFLHCIPTTGPGLQSNLQSNLTPTLTLPPYLFLLSNLSIIIPIYCYPPSQHQRALLHSSYCYYKL